MASSETMQVSTLSQASAVKATFIAFYNITIKHMLIFNIQYVNIEYESNI